MITVGAAASPFVGKYFFGGPSAKAHEAYESGESYFKAHDYDRAQAAFDRAIDTDAEYADAVYYRARARAAGHDYDGAVEDLFKLHEMEPSNPRGYALAGYAFFKLRDFPQAEVELNHALKLSPDDVNSLFTRAQYFAWKHDYAKAIGDLQRLLTVQPLSQRSLYLLAGSYSRLGDVRKAALNCRQLLRLDRHEPRYPELCGLIHHRAEDFMTAVRFYDDALMLAPNAGAIRKNRDLAAQSLPPLASDESTDL